MGYDFTLEDRDARVLPSRKDGRLELEIEGARVSATLVPGTRSGEWTLLLDGTREPLFLASAGDVHFVHWRGQTHRVEARNALLQARARASRAAGAESILAPMPGVVVSVTVAAGDLVEAGALLLTIESMKLQTAITASYAARIEALCVATGEAFDQGRPLVRLGPVTDAGGTERTAAAEPSPHAGRRRGVEPRSEAKSKAEASKAGASRTRAPKAGTSKAKASKAGSKAGSESKAKAGRGRTPGKKRR
ncbi:MAG: biotin/lipoyl-containing protein [Myxococcota bacterium]